MFLLCLNLWLMVIDCLSVFLFSFGCLPVFLFGFDYLCFCRGKAFPLSTSFPFMYSFISPFLIFRILLFSALFFFNQPAPGLRGSSYTERNSARVISYI